MKTIVLLLSILSLFGFSLQNIDSVQPKPIYKHIPQYPENARKLRVEAEVALNVLIGKDGNVKETDLLQAIIFYPGKSVSIESLSDLNNIPSTHRQTAAKLLELAHQSAQQWKFTPAMINGKPDESVIVIPFTFKLTSANQEKNIQKKK